jgi:signal transduction histidine kinase
MALSTTAFDVDDADHELARYDVVGRPAGQDLQSLVELAALVCEVPTAALNLVTSDAQHQVATVGVEPSICRRADSMCATVLDQPDLVVVSDASEDLRFWDNPFVAGPLGAVRFYASAQLRTPRGVSIGRLCVFDDRPRTLTAQQRQLLEVLAARVVDVLELQLRGRELEQSLDALTRTRDELRRSNELLSLFAGQVSHDLRSPLTAILASTELLAQEPVVRDDPGLAPLAHAALAAGRRMTSMIEEMLEQARAGARPRLDDVDLGGLLEDVLADLAPVLTERGALARHDELPVVRADRHQLYVVLLNLLSNAVKFTPLCTRPVVELRARRQEHCWRVEVRDNGAGIPADRRASVFDLYARAAPGIDGSGIGLATARRAVEAHGGEIGVEDGAAAGTTIWFTLPA